MKRYNCKHFPVEMEETSMGYWISWEDHERAVLDYNKTASRTWEVETIAQQQITEQWSNRVENQQHKIILLSVAVFALSAILLFKLLA